MADGRVCFCCAVKTGRKEFSLSVEAIGGGDIGGGFALGLGDAMRLSNGCLWTAVLSASDWDGLVIGCSSTGTGNSKVCGHFLLGYSG
ncbi:MAG: hypothetical protein ACI4QD_07455 [Kiritimatiellia bacterium]